MNNSTSCPPDYPSHPLGPTSLELLQRTGQNDAAGWQSLVLLYGPVVRYWIRRRGIGAKDEIEVLGAVLMAAQRKLGTFARGDEGPRFQTWLKTVAVLKIAEFHRRHSRSSPAGPELQPWPAAAAMVLATPSDKPPTRQALQILREEFTAEQWRAFWLTAVDGYTTLDAADELAQTPVAVRQAKSLVLARLRDYLNGSGEFELDSATC